MCHQPSSVGADGDPTREYAQQLTMRIPGSSVMKASFVSLTKSLQLKEIKGMRRGGSIRSMRVRVVCAI
jgi:hypothetical protein